MEASNNTGENGDNIRSRFLSKGAYVQVAPGTRRVGPNKEGGVGHVLDWHLGLTFDVQYVLDRRVEKNVAVCRISSMNPLTVSARRTQGNSLERPSILSSSHL